MNVSFCPILCILTQFHVELGPRVFLALFLIGFLGVFKADFLLERSLFKVYLHIATISFSVTHRPQACVYMFVYLLACLSVSLFSTCPWKASG